MFNAGMLLLNSSRLFPQQSSYIITHCSYSVLFHHLQLKSPASLLSHAVTPHVTRIWKCPSLNGNRITRCPVQPSTRQTANPQSNGFQFDIVLFK
jgi:hypothetical protein